MSYADTHTGCSTATVLASNSWPALTATVLATILSSTTPVLENWYWAASVDPVLAYYGHRMNFERGPARISRSCAKSWQYTGILRTLFIEVYKSRPCAASGVYNTQILCTIFCTLNTLCSDLFCLFLIDTGILKNKIINNHLWKSNTFWCIYS